MEINNRKTDLKNLPSNYARSQAAKPEPLSESWVAAIFAKLQARYGHKWTSNYPPGDVLNMALHEWREGLTGFTAGEIKHGLDTWEGDWPPSLPEFKKSCKGGLVGGRTHAQMYEHTALPPPPAKKAIWPSTLGKFMRGLRKVEDWDGVGGTEVDADGCYWRE